MSDVRIVADVRTIAQKFIEKSNNKGQTLTAMQLLKLCYIAQGVSLGIRKSILFDNQIEAWKFGPVIPDLYHAISHYGDKPVVELPVLLSRALLEGDDEIIDIVFGAYGSQSGIKLSSLTHQPNTPWKKVYRADRINIPIPNDLIEEYYSKILSE